MTIVEDQKRVKEGSVIKIRHVKSGTYLNSNEIDRETERMQTIRS